MNSKLRKFFRLILILGLLFLTYVGCTVLNQLLNDKIKNQEEQTLQTISDVLYGTEYNKRGSDTE